MQTQERNYRFRGWRDSRTLIEGVHSVPCDLKKITSDYYRSQSNYDSLRTLMDTLVQTRVSQLQHLRKQLTWRLRNT